jgi:hypothetical protein
MTRLLLLLPPAAVVAFAIHEAVTVLANLAGTIAGLS